MAQDNKDLSMKEETFGFENDSDLLSEINYRLSLINKNNIYLKNIPRKLTRTSLREMIPEMITCRFPENSYKGNKRYAFIQLPDEKLVLKYVDHLNNKVLNGKKLSAKRYENTQENTDISNFNMKILFFNGLKPETKYLEVKKEYPKAKIVFPTDGDKMSLGYVRIKFETKEDALSAFVANNLVLHGVKCHLNFLLNKKTKVDKKISITDEQLLEEITSRFKAQHERTIMVKNLPNTFNLSKLKKLAPSMRNCKISVDKKLGFIDFDSSELAQQAVKELNGKSVEGKKIRAFVPKRDVKLTLSEFNLKKLHLTNLSTDTTQGDISELFPKCQIELNLNTDKSCIGNASLEFDCEKYAMSNFFRKDLKIKDVTVFVNFQMETKSSESVKHVHETLGDEKLNEAISTKEKRKRSMNDSSDEESTDVIGGKKRKINDGGDSLEPELKVVRVAGIDKKGAVNRKKSLIPTAQSNVAKTRQQTDKKVTTTETKGKTKSPIGDKVGKVGMTNGKKIATSAEKVGKVSPKVQKVGPLKRKFIEDEKQPLVEETIKKTRILAKRGVSSNLKNNQKTNKPFK